MKKEPINSKLYGIIVLYEMHTDFLIKALDGIKESDAQNRLNTEANHIAWITGSVVYGRHVLAKSLGVDIESATGVLFKDNRGIVGNANYPSISDFKADWKKISPILQEALTTATEEKLNEPFEMPGMEISLFNMISFGTYREANCIGQIALWRRLLGYPGMNYM